MPNRPLLVAMAALLPAALTDGALPLDVLEARIERWIAAR